ARHPALFADAAEIERHALVDACEKVSCKLIAAFRSQGWLPELMAQATRPWEAAHADDNETVTSAVGVAPSVLLLRDGLYERLDVHVTLPPQINDEGVLTLGIRV